MIYFNAPLANYDADAFTMPIQAGELYIFLRFSWPTTLQKIYDMEYAKLRNVFQSIPLITTVDMVNVDRATNPLPVIDRWKLFVEQWEAETLSPVTVSMMQWPYALRTQLQAYLNDNTDDALYNEIILLLDGLSAQLDLMSMIDDELIWHITAEYNGQRREACLSPNCWLDQGASDYRLCFKTLKSRVGRNDLGEVTLYIAQGDGDL